MSDPDLFDNPFLRQGDAQLVAPVRRVEERREQRMRVKLSRSDKDAPMKPGAQEQDQIDRSIQVRQWKAANRAELELVRAGPHASAIGELETLLRSMTIDGGDLLVDFVKHSTLPAADVQTRYVALSLIAAAIIRLRIRNGLPPIDDSIPFLDEEPTIFEICRAELRVP